MSIGSWLEGSRVGGQLSLDLFPGEPWGGRSPRGLTRVTASVIFEPARPPHEVFFDPEQFELWRADGAHGVKGVRRVLSPGAPTLLPLPRRYEDG